MSTWQSERIPVDGMEIHVQAQLGAVDIHRTVDGVDAQDTRLTPDQARTLAVALIDGADHAEGVA
jgi:hypothetical protein